VGGCEEALRLAAEGVTDSPGVDLNLQASLVGDLDEAPHVVPVVEEVVLGEGVQDTGEAAFGKILHICSDVPEDAIAEI
jgi:hypothetical protein